MYVIAVYALNFHRKSVHEGIKNHKCLTCGKKFSSKCYLKIDIRQLLLNNYFDFHLKILRHLVASRWMLVLETLI